MRSGLGKGLFFDWLQSAGQGLRARRATFQGRVDPGRAGQPSAAALRVSMLVWALHRLRVQGGDRNLLCNGTSSATTRSRTAFLPIILKPEEVDAVFVVIKKHEGYELTIRSSRADGLGQVRMVGALRYRSVPQEMFYRGARRRGVGRSRTTRRSWLMRKPIQRLIACRA